MSFSRDDAIALDRADPLTPARTEFELPENIIYLDGNSLGALPKRTPARLAEVARAEWGQDLIKSWTTHDWIDLPARVGDKIARLIGAAPGEVIVADFDLDQPVQGAVGGGASQSRPAGHPVRTR